MKGACMEIFILGSLSACLLFFLLMSCVSLIGVEKKVMDMVRLAEEKVTRLYQGE
jgi:hypothetical protein